jgi:putative DNA primase/helicase
VDVLATALELHALGYWPVLIRPGEKRPIGKQWGVEQWTAERLRDTHKKFPAAGVGICFGPQRGPGGAWLIDIEGDGSQADQSLDTLMGGHQLDTVSWTATRGNHLVFTADGERLLKLLAKAGGVQEKGEGKSGVWKLAQLPGLEWRIGGFAAGGAIKQVQSVCPPTPGTDGKPRTWTGHPINGTQWVFGEVYDILGSLAKPDSLKVSDLYPRTDVETRAIAYLDKIEASVSGQEGSKKTFGAVCRVGPGFDLAPDVALRLIRTHYNPRCQPPWTEKDLAHKVEDAYKTEPRRGWLLDQKPGTNGHHAILAPSDKDPINPTDLGNARRLVSYVGGQIRYCWPWTKWIVWRASRWKVDDIGSLQAFARDVVVMIGREGLGANGIDKELLKWALKSESRERLAAMIGVAQSEDGIPILPSDLDTNPDLLNVLNGTIDLRTGKIRAHHKGDMITALAPVSFDEMALCPTWLSVIDTVFNQDQELIRFWQQLCGLCLTGNIGEQILPILYGTGANGKSTMLGALLEILGPDYAIVAPPGLLMTRHNDSHPTERASLFGKRLVVDMESAEGARMNESIVKQLTGSDRISARRMREDFWDFAPTHKIIMATNHKPEIRETKNAIWRRIKLIPFTHSIPEDKQIRDLPVRLRTEYSGILSWCIRGCLDWRKNGLIVPPSVAAATQAYQSEEDVLGEFIAENCVVGPNYRERASRLYERYSQAMDRAGVESKLSQTAFGRAMAERGFKKIKSSHTSYLGIALRQTTKKKISTPY